ncbi:hypothetical protein, partial [Parafrankia elaeagni]|uniref:hypothetical protein n=1 Tax=Parafrankia elaeagni TaxID=222534 RepID=UPI0018A87A82
MADGDGDTSGGAAEVVAGVGGVEVAGGAGGLAEAAGGLAGGGGAGGVVVGAGGLGAKAVGVMLRIRRRMWVGQCWSAGVA